MTTHEKRVAEIQARTDAATPGPWEEVWKEIPGSVGYEVSDHGRVRSYFKKGNHRDKRSEYPRTLSTAGKGGYLTVSIPNEQGNYQTKAVHRLVMLAFVGEPPLGMEVAHLNGDPTDARLSNLAYVTHVENEAHKLAHGTATLGERNGASKLLGWQVTEMRYLASMSVPQGKIAALFDVNQKYVRQVLARRIWPDLPDREDIPFLLACLAEAGGRIADALRLKNKPGANKEHVLAALAAAPEPEGGKA